MILNENSTQRSRRLSTRLADLPDINLEAIIANHSSAQNLDPRLVRALIQAESGLQRQGGVEQRGDRADAADAGHGERAQHPHPYDPSENVRGGTMYLRQMIDHFAGRIELAIAAYNAGPGAVESTAASRRSPRPRTTCGRVLSLWRGTEISLPSAASTAAAMLLPGSHRKPYLIRGANNRLVLTTSLGGAQ